MEKVTEFWSNKGLETNSKKTVNRLECEEVQGVYIHGSEGWLGVSRAKRVMLLQAGLSVLGRSICRVRMMQRFVGKATP